MKKTLLAAVLAAGAAVAPANASVVLFSDFDSITAPVVNPGGYTTLSFADGWTGGANGIEIQQGAAGTPFSSPNLVELDTYANSSMFVALGAGHYTVSYYYSPRPGVGSDSNGISLSIGNTALDSVTGNGGGDTAFTLRNVDFVTKGGNLTFAATGTSDSYGGYLDSITISAVPEPATWGLMLAGFAMTGFAARRRKNVVTA